jgi:hypothetical protein
VTFDGAICSGGSVSYASTDGSAVAGSDYTTVSDTLTVLSGATGATITVTTTEDSIYESDETLRVDLSSPSSNMSLSDSAGTGTITNDDQIPYINFQTTSASL